MLQLHCQTENIHTYVFSFTMNLPRRREWKIVGTVSLKKYKLLIFFVDYQNKLCWVIKFSAAKPFIFLFSIQPTLWSRAWITFDIRSVLRLSCITCNESSSTKLHAWRKKKRRKLCNINIIPLSCLNHHQIQMIWALMTSMRGWWEAWRSSVNLPAAVRAACGPSEIHHAAGSAVMRRETRA